MNSRVGVTTRNRCSWRRPCRIRCGRPNDVRHGGAFATRLQPDAVRSRVARAPRPGCVALGLGAAIGLERQWRSRMAGMRTNTLVAAGSATGGSAASASAARWPIRRGSPHRWCRASAFSVRGVIMREGLNVRGLNGRDALVLGGGGVAGRRGAVPLLALAGAFQVIRDEHGAAAPDSCAAARVSARRRSRTSTRSGRRGGEERAYRPGPPRAVDRERRHDPARHHGVEVASGVGDAARRAGGPPGARVDVLERIVQRLGLDPKVRSVRWWNRDRRGGRLGRVDQV